MLIQRGNKMTSKNFVDQIEIKHTLSKGVALDELEEYRKLWSNGRFHRHMSLHDFIESMERIRQ